MKTTKKTAGFSLVETLFAGFVFTVSSLGLSASLAQSNNSSESVRQELAARTAIRSLLADLRAMPIDQVVSGYTSKTFEIEGLRSPDQGACGSVTCTPITGGAKDLYRVRVTARWMQGRRVQEIEAAHLLTRLYG